MIFTKIAWVFGLLVVATMCWLAIRGLSIVVPFLVTGLVLVVLVGGGNLLNGRSSPYGRDRSSGAEGTGEPK